MSCVAALLDGLGPLEEREHSAGQVTPTALIEIEDHPGHVRTRDVEAATLASSGGVPQDLAEELRGYPTPDGNGKQRPR